MSQSSNQHRVPPSPRDIPAASKPAEEDNLCYRANSEDAMKLLRREFLHLVAGAAAVPATAFRLAWAQEAHQRVRVATGLLATWQSTAWLGAEAGLFKKRGIDMTLPAIAVGGPQAAAGVHPRRLGVRPHRHSPCRGRSTQRPRHCDPGNADIGILQFFCHDQERDHSADTADRKESRSID